LSRDLYAKWIHQQVRGQFIYGAARRSDKGCLSEWLYSSRSLLYLQLGAKTLFKSWDEMLSLARKLAILIDVKLIY
jgi:hypothetical protein